MEDYKEEHEFPNGLTIDYEKQLTPEYLQDLDQATDDAAWSEFRTKWIDILPELEQDCPRQDVQSARKNHPLQDALMDKALKGDKMAKLIFNYLVPPTLMKMAMTADVYKAAEGVVILQMYNAGMFKVLPDGKWRRQ